MAVQVHLSRCASSALRLACATFEEAATLRSSSSGARALQRTFCAAARSAPDSSSMQPTSQHLRTDLTPGGLGVITMDREKALNAFDHGMAMATDAALQQWGGSEGSGCHAVLVHAASDRAFCSGGDIKSIRQSALESPFSEPNAPPADHPVTQIFQAEYRLVADLAKLAVPAVGLCHGVWMGFGVGLGGFLPIRVVSDKTVFAMPECSIGLLPDVAFAHMAAERMPLYVALYLALTGARVTSASDLLALGMATHYVASGDVEQMRKDLLATDFTPCSDNGVTQAVERHTSPFPQPCEDGVQANINLIQHMMQPALTAHKDGADCVTVLKEVFRGVEQMAHSQDGSKESVNFAAKTLKQLHTGAPRSLALTVEHFTHAYRLAKDGEPAASADGCLTREFNATVRMAGQHDFLEGVRAAVVDKDKQPKWKPATVDDVSAEDVAALLKQMDNGVALQL